MSSEESDAPPPMSAERWLVLEPLVDTALGLAPEQRRAFVSETKRRDPALGAELERAVAGCERDDAFFTGAAVERFAPLLEPSPPELLSGRFLIEREIGRGGMATVFAARDQKHDRAVAVKLLGPETGAEIGVERFLREIRVVAHLQHPHIVPLYDSGDDRGWLYYVMPVMQGGSLRDRIARDGPLSLDVVLQIVREIGGALEHAHRHGLVHRDIKPENILFDDDRALVTDFGIARALAGAKGEHGITATGISIGTPGYMSPEQSFAGSLVDARSDVYSLACVVYEMLTGASPFVVKSPRGVAARNAFEPATPLSEIRSDIPRGIDDVLRRALAPDPDKRFSSAKEFVDALTAAAPGQRGGGQASGVARGSRRRVAVLAGIGVIAVGLIVAFLASRSSRERQAPTVLADPPVLTIAVQPFDNISRRAEDEYLSDGMADELTAALARISGLSVAPRSSAIAFRRVPSRTMGESLHVAWVLEGTLSHVGSTLRVRPTLVNVKTGRVAWSVPYDRELRDIVSVQRDIVQAIADTLRLTLLTAQARPLNRPSENIDAYINYLKGRAYWNQRTPSALDSAITYFNTALTYDSNYASAYSGLADAYSLRGWAGVAPRNTFPKALEAAQRAIALDSNLAAAHASLGFVHIWYEWNWAAGQREIDRAIAMDSTYASAVLFTAFYLIPQGRMREAVLAAQHAQRLEPLSPIINARVGSILAYSHRFREADSALRQTLKNNPGFPIARAQLARLLAIQGRFPEAIAALPPDDGSLGGMEAGVRGFVYALAGDRANAFKQIRALESRSYQSPDAIAAIYTGLGDRDQAFAWLEKAYEARAMTFVLFAAEPMYDGLHADPRFKPLIARIHSVAPVM